MNDAIVTTDLDNARVLAQQGQLDAAEQLCRRVLERDPNATEALNFVAMRSLARGQLPNALDLLQRAVETQPDDVATLKNLGIVSIMTGKFDLAQTSLQHAIGLAPQQFDLQLHLAGLYEQLGRNRAALRTYFRAITAAQNQGLWLSEASTPPPLRKTVVYAMNFVNQQRQQILSAVLRPLRELHGAEAIQRMETCLATYLGDLPTNYADTRQRPKFLYFPGLPTHAYLPRELFAWQDTLEQHTDAIRTELQGLLQQQDVMQPFLGAPSPEEGDAFLRGTRGRPAWDAFFFYRHGERNDANCARSPVTAAIIDSLPLVQIREHAPEICFSLLTPGTHILPHHGVTNTRLVTHLPLIVPQDCAIKVGGELHAWQEGRCVTFDDTFEHEAWNRSDSTRVVLILDCWNPYLTDIERTGITDLVAAIGDFNRDFGLPV